MRTRRAAAVVAGLCAVVGATACSGGGSDNVEAASAGDSAGFAVGFRGETFVDESRSPARTLVTTTYYPATEGAASTRAPAIEGTPPATARGPFPLVLFSHGGGTTGRSYSNLLTRVAAAGYVVVAPNYRGPADDPDARPGDARFVISQAFAATADPGHPLHRLVDGGRVAAMGHSAGGGITLGFAFNSCCLDQRVKAAVLLASARPEYPGEAFPAPGVPALVVHGDADTRAAYADGRQLFEQLRSPKYLLTVHGGEHTPPFSGEMQRTDARVVVESIVAFLDHHLKNQADALDRLGRAAAAEPVTATLERA